MAGVRGAGCHIMLAIVNSIRLNPLSLPGHSPLKCCIRKLIYEVYMTFTNVCKQLYYKPLTVQHIKIPASIRALALVQI